MRHAFRAKFGQFRDILNLERGSDPSTDVGIYSCLKIFNVFHIWVARYRHLGMYIFSHKINSHLSINPYGKSPILNHHNNANPADNQNDNPFAVGSHCSTADHITHVNVIEPGCPLTQDQLEYLNFQL